MSCANPTLVHQGMGCGHMGIQLLGHLWSPRLDKLPTQPHRLTEKPMTDGD